MLFVGCPVCNIRPVIGLAPWLPCAYEGNMNTPRRALAIIIAVFCTADLAIAREATVTVAKGKVTVGTEGQAAGVGAKVAENQIVRTGGGSYAELKFSDGSIGRLGPNAVFRSKGSNFVVDAGEGLFAFAKGKGGFTVSTPSLNAGILGTTVDVKVSRNLVEYSCLEGHCRIGPHTLSPGDKLTLRGSSAAYSAPKTKVDLERFAKDNPLIASLGKLPNFP